MRKMQKKNNTGMYFWPDIFHSVHKPSGEKSSGKITITNNINFY